jgi:hypothetical protein|tara:strand:- start:88 stop:1278 length:1191 start_codon:yes stop_codon:yes gene_type:complete
MFGKLLLVGALSRYGYLEEVANYNYVQSVVAFLVISSGMEAYQIINRDIIHKSGTRFLSEVTIFFIGYLLSGAMIFIFVDGNILSLFWLFPLMVFEHLSQDLFRKLIFFRLQVNASIVLFVRSGLWAYIVSCLIFFDIYNFSFHEIIFIWSASSFLSVILAAYFMSKNEVFLAYAGKLSVKGVFGGALRIIYLSIPYFVMGVFSRIPLVSDKVIIREWVDIETVGIYAIIVTMCYGVFSIFESLVVSYKIPEFINNVDNLDRIRKEVFSYVVSAFVVYFFALVFFELFLFEFKFLGDKISMYREAFYITFLGVVVLSLGIGPHLYIYALAHDKAVVFMSLLFPFTYGGCLYVFSKLGVFSYFNTLPYCFLVAYAVQALSRFCYFAKLQHPKQLRKS